MKRFDMLGAVRARSEVDVLIVGGGINGVGTLRDLARQGVDTLLVERADFCSGASAASSRMAHGGIRYLENGEFRLVREAVQERNRMIRNAPALVQPLPTTIPIFKWFSGLLNAPLKFLGWLEKPSERGAFIIKVGLILYDAFTGGERQVPRHVFENRRRSLEKFPALNPGVAFTATYFDGLILSPERLTLQLVLDALDEGPHARALNYVSLVGIQAGVATLRDETTGETWQVRPRLIINAAGPWIDPLNQRLGLATRYIGPTKGSHLVLDNPELRRAIGDHEFFFENQDGRIVLIFPLFDKVMIGTSDLPIADSDSARCTGEEVDYFIGMVARVFPGIRVEPAQIVFRFSGVRPLASTQARNAGQITRDHHIREDRLGDLPVYSLVGGKWTSYRAFAEQVSDRALAFLGRARRADTRDLPIGPPAGQPALKTSPEYTREEVARMAEQEMIVHLDDLLLRRTLLGYLGQLTLPRLRQLAGWLADALGWDEKQERDEMARALALLADHHQVILR